MTGFILGHRMQHFGCLRILFFYTIKSTEHLHESSHFCLRDYCQKLHICTITKEQFYANIMYVLYGTLSPT